MEALELLEVLSRGEDSRHQFKRDFTNAEQLAAEMAAFANTAGGQLFLGVEDDGSLSGLTNVDIRRLNQLVTNAATNNVRSPLDPFTEIIDVDGALVMVVTIAEGINKPYFDNKGLIWVKRGSDKRKIDSREELKRIFQRNDSVYADEVPVKGTSVALVDVEHFAVFYERLTGEVLTDSGLSIAQIMHNQNLMQDGLLNMAGLLLFGKNPQQFKPTCIIKAISFVGNAIEGTTYRDSADLTGPIRQLYAQAIQFIKRNLRAVQDNQTFNSLGGLEIPTTTLEELLVNALLHRDYFISAPIRLLIFDNRIEIISPGKLPNHLTVENIQNGASIIRNPILTSFATRDELPYRGIGSGILRAMKAYPAVAFDNNEDTETFTVIIQRPIQS